MKVTLLAAVALTAVALSSAADPACVYRKIRGLPMHFADPTDCGRFYRCTNKNLKREVVCPDSKEYNPKTGKCGNRGRGLCNLSMMAPFAEIDNACANEVSGAYLPDPENCRNFYICNDNAAYKQNCKLGTYFDPSTVNCVPDAEKKCASNKCIGETDGTTISDINECRSFYVCNNDEAVKQNCDKGSYYYAEQNNCQPDVGNQQCWENYCLEKPSGAFVKDEKDCHGFFVCENDQPVKQNCPEGSYFNWISLNCQPGECPDDETTTEACTEAPTTEDCTETNSEIPPEETTDCGEETTTPIVPTTEESCTCPGGYIEGELLPHPESRLFYYLCANGRLVEKSCGTGNNFDPETKACVRAQQEDDENYANDETDAIGKRMDMLQRTNRAQLIEDAEHLVYKRLLEESLKQEYIECERVEKERLENERLEKELLERHGFPYITAKRVKRYGDYGYDTDYSKPAASGSCSGMYEEGDVEEDPDNCAKYRLCTGGSMIEQICPLNSYFDTRKLSCALDIDNICPEKLTEEPEKAARDAGGQCNCPGGYVPGQFVPHPTDCEKYYICYDGKLVEQSCGKGNMFDPINENCVPDTKNECNPPDDKNAVCKNKCDGTLLPNPVQCNAFYMCTNGVASDHICPPAHWFNPDCNSCEPDTDEKCVDPCANTTGISFLPHPDCSKFYFCNDGQATVEKCTVGGFDVTIGVCSINATCESTLCVGKDDGVTYAVAGNNKKFYYCLSGVAIIKSCLPNTAYNRFLNVCLPEPSENCNQTVCRSTDVDGAFSTLDQAQSAFCFCRAEKAFEQNCPTDYNFNVALGICYSTAPCDPEICDVSPEYTVTWNRNDSHSFCLCVSNTQVTVGCPNRGIFNALLNICQPTPVLSPNCNQAYCLAKPDYTTFGANNETSGFCMCSSKIASFHPCSLGYTFNSVVGVCLSAQIGGNCNVARCASNPNLVFPANNNPNSFCYCQSETKVLHQPCPNGETFNTTLNICLAQVCSTQYCLNPANDGTMFPASSYPYGFCLCHGSQAVLQPCPKGKLFDEERLVCISEADVDCYMPLCANATQETPYPVAAINDPHAFCYCIGPDSASKFNCPLGKVFNSTIGVCMNPPKPELGEGCTCPGGYHDGQFVPHTENCQLFYICAGGTLHERSCGTGNYYNKQKAICEADTQGVCVAKPPPCTCVGAYREGQLVPHPINAQRYYECSNAQLHERQCPDGSNFEEFEQKCATVLKHFRADVSQLGTSDLELCFHGEIRSVPSNCSQYEVCVDTSWRKRTCPDRLYYNPEQQKCLEPRDDTVCLYARVAGLPECNNATEHETLPSKSHNCGQYYRCTSGKWRLKACNRLQYYSRQLHTCVPSFEQGICGERNGTDEREQELSNEPQCQHTAVRYYADNCAMYLMCLEGEWWYQYCSLGMYFNREHNYCMPNDAAQCPGATLALSSNNATLWQESVAQNCSVEGMLRPSALACDSYYVCVEGRWHTQQCAAEHYFNVTAMACLRDEASLCEQLAAGCAEHTKRAFPLNCSAFEQCQQGEWHRVGCPLDLVFDEQLQQCVSNDGSCAASGLRRACRNGDARPFPLAANCTQFYYCDRHSWQSAACLKGATYSPLENSCVPHTPEDKCRPVQKVHAALVAQTAATLLSGAGDNPCKELADGVAVAHPTDCSRFLLCYASVAISPQQCGIGSFFDAPLGHCLPNLGSCSQAALADVCANASAGALLPHPSDCQAYYHCAAPNATQLLVCAEGEYYHKRTQRCRADRGECRNAEHHRKCNSTGVHGTRLPHPLFCNIYYACVHGLSIAVECAAEQQFNAVLGHCLHNATVQHCQRGQLLAANASTYSCSNRSNGTHLADRTDCSRYYNCSDGVAFSVRCPAGTYFDSERLSCTANDGACPYMMVQPANNITTAPPATVCEGKHGVLFPDPNNCNAFYVCLKGKLRHEHCYSDHYFNGSTAQCQPYDRDSATLPLQQCSDKPTNYSAMCEELAEGATIADPDDCRRFIACSDGAPIPQRCRNGESYDSLLGFCRQTDGTCLLENGQRVGLCNGRHGQLVRDVNNCRGYFVCVNGQEVAQECASHEYFNRSLSICQQDVFMQCSQTLEASQTTVSTAQLSCSGLSEAVLYAYVYNQCRSYFQCVKGVPSIHECADGLYFNATSTRCVKEISECSMPQIQNMQRAPDAHRSDQMLCGTELIGHRYAALNARCRSYYICQTDGVALYMNCPNGTLFSAESGACAAAENVICDL